MRHTVPTSAVLLLGALVFCAWMHPLVLWPTNFGWLLTGEDRGQAAIGLLAYLRAGGPGLREPLLSAPEGTALLFTDSIPLLGILFRPLAAWLPRAVQFIGAWYLACCLLQAGFAALLVRRVTREPVAWWCGAALLTLFPVLLNRYGHASLCAQWLLLWALWVFVEPRRAVRPLWWAAVLGIAAAVHSYLLLMVAAFWGSALLEQLWRGERRGRALAHAVLALLPAAVLLWLHGAFAGGYASTGTYGAFPAALDAWWNPANPGYTALPISSRAMPQGRGFEGFNYLGAGLILLAAVAAWRLATGTVDENFRDLRRRLCWLLPALVVLAMLAIGPAPVWRGQVLYALSLPPRITDTLDAVRASGRLLWPASYLLAYAAIACVARGRNATLLLAAALALQVVDLAPMVAAIRATSVRAADRTVYTLTRDPRWAALVAQAGDVEFEPARPFLDMALAEEIGWRAVQHCRPLRWSYASRDTLATRTRVAADAQAFAAGRLVSTRLYVLIGRDSTPPSVAARVQVIDGVRIIPPSRPAPRVSCS
ncbi:DUF6311 domain-containing protein [Sphingomonas sp.]|uniref:DUF6311 domain-containing protein n=1 Tax=Sphingomonas sp. TaxID=28214 RepID=UPI003CC65142